VATNTAPIMINRTPCGDPFFRSKDARTPENPTGTPCSVRAAGPHASLNDGRGGVRLVGTIHDFTFSLAHYYTWSDTAYVRATMTTPSPQHLLWDLNGLGNPNLVPKTNPWGPNDPVVGLTGPGTPGGFLTFGGDGTPAAIERNLRSTVNSNRVQITGASLSFPVNALTGMFVGSDNPLYYIYTTFRSEFAYTQNVPIAQAFHDLSAGPRIQGYLTPTVLGSGIPLDQIPLAGALGFAPEFAPGGIYAREAGSRAGAVNVRDTYAWVVGLDHNQWIRWLNQSNSFTFSAQLFWNRILGGDKRFTAGKAAGLSNDVDALAVRPRTSGPNPNNRTRPGGGGNRTVNCISPTATGGTTTVAPCAFRGLLGFPVESQVFTLAVSTPYMGGNLTPNLAFIYDFSGSWLVQPGVNWTFWEPFRMQVRYNYIDGRYAGIGFFKTRDSVWLELQYLLY
jgi:hypothetical protein